MSGRLTKENKAILEPYAQLLAQIYERVEKCSDDELAILVRTASHATSGNCWWAMFRASQMVSDIASDELSRRALEGSRSDG